MKRFKKIYIEITNICNLKCSFCSIDNRKKEYMSIDNFKEIINKIKDYTDYIYLHVKGEPLLHPELDNILKMVEDNNLKVNLTTNACFLKEKSEILKKYNCINKINISLHSENNKENYFDEIFETVDNNLLDKTIVYRIWTLNNGELDNKSTEIVDKIRDYYKLSTEHVDKIIKERNINIKGNIYLDKDNEFVWPSDSNTESNGYCFALKTQIAILVDGTVVPCCLDSNGDVNLGNIFNTSLDEIIRSDRFINLQKSFQDRKPCERLCQNCTFKDKFK